MGNERRRHGWTVGAALALPVLYVMSALSLEALWAFGFISDEERPSWIVPFYRPLLWVLEKVPWLGELYREYTRWLWSSF